MKEYNALSLFDGMSCGRIALQRAGITYDKYFASEIDKYAISVTRKNYPNTIQLGDVKNLRYEDGVLINSSKVSAQSRERYYWTNIPNIQQPEEKGIVVKDILEPVVDEKFYGSEALLGRLVRHKNKIVRDNFENPEKSACIHAGYFKGGGRDQQYIVEKPILVGRVSNHQGDRVIDINGKAYALTASGGNNGGGGSSLFSMTNEEGEIIRLRKFTPLECERLQTIPDNYTALGIDEKGNEVKISNTQRYRMVGNSWTCSVISHIFKNLK